MIGEKSETFRLSAANKLPALWAILPSFVIRDALGRVAIEGEVESRGEDDPSPDRSLPWSGRARLRDRKLKADRARQA